MPTKKWAYLPFTLLSPLTFVFSVYKLASPTIVNDPLIPQVTNVIGWGTMIAMLVVDNIIYGLLAWYFCEISPGEYGVPKSKLFFLEKSYWIPQKRGQSQVHDYEENEDTEMFEPINTVNDKGVGVTLSNLDKIFDMSGSSPVHAVAGISAGFGRGGITSLLGHNGAGKSTTISMLVGLITPTSGDAFIEGKSILNDMDDIRKSIGICPQMDLLFPTLSATEHLELVGKLRTGSSSKNLKEEIYTALSNIGLPTNDQQAKTFSGGMKRKLSLLMALFCDPKVVFLDEPTTGIDTLSKRQIWDTLLMAKRDKTIILTTHSMEEADALSDYIYIMSEGKIKCGGTSIFLKRNFGIGYYLNVEKGANFDTDSFLNFVQSKIKGATVLKDSHQTATLGIPFGFTQMFPSIFKEIDKRLNEFGIQSYGLSITTLEDVFIRMGSNTEVRGVIKEDEKDVKNMPSDYNNNDEDDDDDDNKMSIELKKPLVGQYAERNPSTKARQAQVVAWMNAIFYLRRWKRSLAIILIPAILMVCFLVPSMLNNFEMPQAPDKDLHNTYITSSSQRLTDHITIPYAVTDPDNVSESDLTNFFDSITNITSKVSFVEYSSLYDIDVAVEKAGYYEAALGINALSSETRTMSVTLMHNASVSYSLPSIQNLVSNAFMKIIRDDTIDPDITINSYSHGLSLFPTNVKSTSMSMFLVISIMFGLLISSAMSAQRLVSERECMFKSQMFLAGMDPVVYPSLNILVSIIPLLISSIISALIATSFGVTGTRGVMFFPFILTLILFSLALAPFNYVFSRMFNKADSCISNIIKIHISAYNHLFFIIAIF